MIGPNGEKRPADVTANALRVAKIATGEAEEVYVDESKRLGGQKGGRARADALTPDQRRKIAKSGAAARWREPADSAAATEAKEPTHDD